MQLREQRHGVAPAGELDCHSCGEARQERDLEQKLTGRHFEPLENLARQEIEDGLKIVLGASQRGLRPLRRRRGGFREQCHRHGPAIGQLEQAGTVASGASARILRAPEQLLNFMLVEAQLRAGEELQLAARAKARERWWRRDSTGDQDPHSRCDRRTELAKHVIEGGLRSGVLIVVEHEIGSRRQLAEERFEKAPHEDPLAVGRAGPRHG